MLSSCPMIYRMFLLLAITVCLTPAVRSQPFNYEASLVIDNDAFLFSAVDRYYSSGIFATLKMKPRRRTSFARRFFAKDSAARENISLQLAHVFYTPYNPRWSNPDLFDRPYAGWIYVQAGWQGTSKSSSLRLSADLGVLGPATKVEPLQRWWHDIFGFRQLRGWEHQINNTPSLHASLNYMKRLVRHPAAEIYWESSNRLGTILSQSVNGLSIRLGELKPFAQSAWGGNKINNEPGKPGQLQELFFYIKEDVRYRLYDATVQGNFIGKSSPHTETLKPWLFHHQVGMCVAFHRFDMMLAHNITSKETPESKFHQYITFEFFYRF